MTALGGIYIFLMIAATSAQSIFQKGYNLKLGGRGSSFFSAASALVALAFFSVKASIFNSFAISLEVIPYALLYGIGYAVASVFYLLSMNNGPLSLSSLVLSYSMIIPTGWGILVDGDELTPPLIAGLALLLISIFILNFGKTDSSRISGTWVVFALLTFLGNGVCQVTQTEQASRFLGAYDDMFMISSLSVAVLLMLGFSLVFERDALCQAVKAGAPFYLSRGVLNALGNLLAMLIAAIGINKSVMFPLSSAGGIVLTWAISVFIYRERLSLKQNVAMILGTLSVVFLSL